MLVVFDDIIADTLCNKNVLQIVTELFIRCRKLNISLVFITDEQQKYHHYHQVYEYLTGEEILPSDQSRIIEQANFTSSPLGKAFEKQ